MNVNIMGLIKLQFMPTITSQKFIEIKFISDCIYIFHLTDIFVYVYVS